MAGDGANGAIITIPEGFSPIAWVSNNVREIVDKRVRLGDLEADFVMGKAHKSALLVITDRATLLTRLKKVDTRKQMLARIPKSFIKTLTVDNDKGFANHASIVKTLDANVYFTRPYISQDKGTVENRIGVNRQFFPKGTDLRNVTVILLQ